MLTYYQIPTFYERTKNFVKANLADIRTDRSGKIPHTIRMYVKHYLKGTPLAITIEPVNLCNLKCPACTAPPWELKREAKYLQIDEFKKIIDHVKDYTQYINFYLAGEPLLNTNIYEMIRYAEENNLSTCISTNATLLNEQNAKKLLESGLTKLIISFDGPNKEAYERFRVGANYEQVVKNIERFSKMKRELGYLKPLIEVQVIVTKYNEAYVDEMRALAKKWKVNSLRFKTFALTYYLYDENKVKKLASYFLPRKKDSLSRYNYDEQKQSIQLKRSNKPCQLAIKTRIILADGTLALCCYDVHGQYKFGNLIENDFGTIFNSQHYKQMHHMGVDRQHKICEHCPYP